MFNPETLGLLAVYLESGSLNSP